VIHPLISGPKVGCRWLKSLTMKPWMVSRLPMTMAVRAAQEPHPNMINIAERSAAVEDRVVPGHWESQ